MNQHSLRLPQPHHHVLRLSLVVAIRNKSAQISNPKNSLHLPAAKALGTLHTTPCQFGGSQFGGPTRSAGPHNSIVRLTRLSCYHTAAPAKVASAKSNGSTMARSMNISINAYEIYATSAIKPKPTPSRSNLPKSELSPANLPSARQPSTLSALYFARRIVGLAVGPPICN